MGGVGRTEWRWIVLISMGVVMAGHGCARAPSLKGRTVEVDRIEDEVATVIDRRTGEVEDLPARRLPKGAQEGQVLVDGRVDEALTAQQRSEVADARAALRRVPPKRLSLEEPADSFEVQASTAGR